MTVGSVPPALGGQTNGGVAVVHNRLLDGWSQSRAATGLSLVGTVATNGAGRPTRDHALPCRILCPPADRRGEREWYLGTLRSLRPDCVIFFHVAHRWAKYHLNTDVPMVAAIHSWTAVNRRSPADRKKIIDFLERVLERSNAVVMPSKHTAEEGRVLGFQYPVEPIIAYNALPEAFAGVLNVSSPARQWNRIVSVGNLLRLKRFDLTIEAASVVGREVVLIGDGPEKQRLVSLGEETLGTGGFSFKGALAHGDVRDEMLDAGCYCGPSETESFGNTYIEALSCGLPVIGFDSTLSEIRDIMGSEVGAGVKAHETVDEVVAALDHVSSQVWDRKRMASGARDCFSVEKLIAGYVSAVKVSTGR